MAHEALPAARLLQLLQDGARGPRQAGLFLRLCAIPPPPVPPNPASIFLPPAASRLLPRASCLPLLCCSAAGARLLRVMRLLSLTSSRVRSLQVHGAPAVCAARALLVHHHVHQVAQSQPGTVLSYISCSAPTAHLPPAAGLLLSNALLLLLLHIRCLLSLPLAASVSASAFAGLRPIIRTRS